jgi:hypothetical protein
MYRVWGADGDRDGGEGGENGLGRRQVIAGAHRGRVEAARGDAPGQQVRLRQMIGDDDAGRRARPIVGDRNWVLRASPPPPSLLRKNEAESPDRLLIALDFPSWPWLVRNRLTFA